MVNPKYATLMMGIALAFVGNLAGGIVLGEENNVPFVFTQSHLRTNEMGISSLHMISTQAQINSESVKNEVLLLDWLFNEAGHNSISLTYKSAERSVQPLSPRKISSTLNSN